jgi:hypothetical protein
MKDSREFESTAQQAERNDQANTHLQITERRKRHV